MRLVVLGATGGTGLEVIRQAVEQGHQVTAFVRNPERLRGFDGRIRIVQGDLLNQEEMARAIAGHEAILSAFGAEKAGEEVWGGFATAVTRAMASAGLRRVVVLSVAFLFRDAVFPPVFFLGRLLFPKVVAGAGRMEEVVRKSGLEWTIVRPPQFTDGPYTGRYRVREGHLPRFGFKISRADVAAFLLRALDDSGLTGKVMGLAY